MRPIILSGAMSFPIGLIPTPRLIKACTLKYQPMGEEEPLEIPAYRSDGEYIHVPRQLGISLCQREGLDFEDCTSPGFPAKFPKIPEPRDYQIEPLLELDDVANDYFDFLFRARTGWGKTVGGLIFAARRGRTTLIVVDQENLKDQWIEKLTNPKFFGFKPEQVGLIQGKVCRYEGCAVTIAMVQTLSQKRFPQEVYDYFGTMLVDEVHIIGAPTFSSVLLDFSATCRIGVSATPKRRDGLQKALDYHLGRVRLYIDDEHPENSVYVTEHDSVYSFYANTSPKMGRFINEISDDAARNLLLAESIAWLYDTGRDVLVLSDRIEHLKNLMVLCEYMGLPADDLGLYAGYNPQYGFAKDAQPARRPVGLTRGEDGEDPEYTPIALQSIAKRIKKQTLDDVKANARVIFATYGMFQKGVDVPRLTGGVDATPRSTAEQIQGRILRGLEGALRSIWITVGDTNSYRSLHSLVSRLREYPKNNATVFRWSLDEGEQPCRVDELTDQLLKRITSLKSMRIEANRDGLLTLRTQRDQVASAMERVNAIKQRTQSRPDRPVSSRAARLERSTGPTSSTRSSVSPSRSPRPPRR